MTKEVIRITRHPWWKRYSSWIITEEKRFDIRKEKESQLFTFLWYANLVKSFTPIHPPYPIEQRIEIRKIERS